MESETEITPPAHSLNITDNSTHMFDFSVFELCQPYSGICDIIAGLSGSGGSTFRGLNIQHSPKSANTANGTAAWQASSISVSSLA